MHEDNNDPARRQPTPGDELDDFGYPLAPALRVCLLCGQPGLPSWWQPGPADADLVDAPRREDGTPAHLLLFLCFSCIIKPGCDARIRQHALRVREAGSSIETTGGDSVTFTPPQPPHCDLCASASVHDVRVPTHESLSRLCWTCTRGLVDAGWDVQVPVPVIKVLPPEPGSTKPTFGECRREFRPLSREMLAQVPQQAPVDLDELIASLFGRGGRP